MLSPLIKGIIDLNIFIYFLLKNTIIEIYPKSMILITKHMNLTKLYNKLIKL